MPAKVKRRGPDRDKRKPRGMVAPVKPDLPVAYSLRAAEVLFVPAISRLTLIRAIKSGALSRRRLGNRHVLTHDDLRAFANSLPKVSRKMEIIP